MMDGGAALADVPAVRATLVSDVCGALSQRGLFAQSWRALRRKQPEWAKELAVRADLDWVSADAYAALLDEALVLARGTDRLRAIGRDWVRRELGPGGRYAAVRQDWLDTFGDEPGEVLRLAPRLWRVTMRNNGRVVKIDGGRGFIRAVLTDAPLIYASPAWLAVLEGSLQGLLELSRPEIQVQLAPSAVDPGVVEGLVLWPTR